MDNNNQIKKTDVTFIIELEDLIGNLLITLKSNGFDVTELSYDLIAKYENILAKELTNRGCKYCFKLSRDLTHEFLLKNSQYYEQSQDEKSIILVHDLDVEFLISKYRGYLSLNVLKTIISKEVVDKTLNVYKGEKMIINYSDQEVIKGQKSIFLAGPTPRGENTKTWRTDACNYLKENGFDGVVYVPEYSTWKPKADYVDQAMWEREALSNASVILFWIPRELPDMPAFTTNYEFGYWIHTGRIIYGRPDTAVKIKYSDWLYKEDYGLEPYNNLEDLLSASIDMANKLGVNEHNEILPVYKRKIFK